MKKLLLSIIILLSLNFYGQSRSDIINAYVEIMEHSVGDSVGVEENGLIGLSLLNENNNTLVYQYKFSNKQTADSYKANGTKDMFVKSSPNDFTKRMKRNKITVKWRYYYNNKMVIEFTVYPNEWND